MEYVETRSYAHLKRYVDSLVLEGTGGVVQVVGEPGTGKTAAVRRLVGHVEVPGLYLACGPEMSPNTLLQAVCQSLTQETIYGATWRILQRLKALGPWVLVLDEANHLGWECLESVRWLADNAGWVVVIAGTDLMARQLKDGKTAVLLAQFTSRIGYRCVKFGAMDAVELATWLLKPRFGSVSPATAKAFHAATSGYWRESVTLVDACAQVMEAQKVAELSRDIVLAAGAFLTGRPT